MHWSTNLQKTAPTLIKADAFNEKERAYPYNDTNEGFVQVTDRSVTFIGQTGPIKEVGVNGCQIDDVLTFVLGTLQTFSNKFPCRENSIAITKLEECLHWLEARKRDREARSVEGLNKS